jgi:phosphatidylglycerophosphate synthase
VRSAEINAGADRAAPTEGERWAREQLVLLRDAGFGPRATACFLFASRARAREQRAARPGAVRRIRGWIAAGAAAHTALALTRREPFAGRTRAFLVWWGLTWLMLDWHVGMLETEDGTPRNLGAADACTLLRVWLVPAAARTPRPWMCALALASDGLDGALARRAGPTRIGRDLEGLADVAFAAAALRGALRHGWLGRGAARAEVGRLALGTGYATAVWLRRAEPPRARVLHAARAATPLRAGGLVAAGRGHRRLADALVIGGALCSALATAAAVRPRAGSRRSRSRSSA